MNFTCSLCLLKCEEFVHIFSENGKKQNVAELISKYLWFEILEEPDLLKIICNNCWWNLDVFNTFYTNIEIAQKQVANNNKFQIPFVDVESLTIDEKWVASPSNNIEVQCNAYISNISSEYSSNLSENETDLHTTDDKNIVKTKNCNVEEIDELPRNIPNTRNKASTTKRKYHESTTKKNGCDKKLELENARQKKLKLREEKLAQEANEMRQYFDMKCDICNSTFQSLMDVQQHYRNVHNNPKGYVKCCGRKLFCRSQIFEHIAYHINPDKYRCKICVKSFIDKKGLDNHMEVHVPIESRQYKCDICGISFARKRKLKYHQQYSHSQLKEKKFICDICNKCYITKAILSVHVRRVHRSDTTCVCDVCAKTFKRKSQLEDHKSYVHLKVDKPRIQCTICGSRIHKTALRKHIRIRHKNDPQKCPYCGEFKKNKDVLRSHVNLVHIHIISPNKYKCSICAKIFQKAISLKEHMASHTGKSLYTCQYCPKTCNSSSNMSLHRKRMHPVEWKNAQMKRLDDLTIQSSASLPAEVDGIAV